MAGLQLWQYNGCIETQVETSGQVGDQLQADDAQCSSLLRGIVFEFRAQANKQTRIAMLFREHTYVPRYLCSPVPMFPEPMFPGAYVPRYLCSPIPMFPGFWSVTYTVS